MATKLVEHAREHAGRVRGIGRDLGMWDAVECGYGWELAQAVQRLDDRGALSVADEDVEPLRASTSVRDRVRYETSMLARRARIYTELVSRRKARDDWDALECGYAWELAGIVQQMDERGAFDDYADATEPAPE